MTIQTSVSIKLHAYFLSSSLYYTGQSLKFCYTLRENITKVRLSVLTRDGAVCVQICNAIIKLYTFWDIPSVVAQIVLF
jgi:hypothetical protein